VLTTDAMRPPDDFRAMADQCLNWAREAPNADAHDACLILARVWLKVAAQTETAANDPLTAPTLGCNRPPFLGNLKDALRTSPHQPLGRR
jgi:hypothetical protein